MIAHAINITIEHVLSLLSILTRSPGLFECLNHTVTLTTICHFTLKVVPAVGSCTYLLPSPVIHFTLWGRERDIQIELGSLWCWKLLLSAIVSVSVQQMLLDTFFQYACSLSHYWSNRPFMHFFFFVLSCHFAVQPSVVVSNLVVCR